MSLSASAYARRYWYWVHQRVETYEHTKKDVSLLQNNNLWCLLLVYIFVLAVVFRWAVARVSRRRPVGVYRVVDCVRKLLAALPAELSAHVPSTVVPEVIRLRFLGKSRVTLDGVEAAEEILVQQRGKVRARRVFSLREGVQDFDLRLGRRGGAVEGHGGLDGVGVWKGTAGVSKRESHDNKINLPHTAGTRPRTSHRVGYRARVCCGRRATTVRVNVPCCGEICDAVAAWEWWL